MPIALDIEANPEIALAAALALGAVVAVGANWLTKRARRELVRVNLAFELCPSCVPTARGGASECPTCGNDLVAAAPWVRRVDDRSYIGSNALALAVLAAAAALLPQAVRDVLPSNGYLIASGVVLVLGLQALGLAVYRSRHGGHPTRAKGTLGRLVRRERPAVALEDATPGGGMSRFLGAAPGQLTPWERRVRLRITARLLTLEADPPTQVGRRYLHALALLDDGQIEPGLDELRAVLDAGAAAARVGGTALLQFAVTVLVHHLSAHHDEAVARLSAAIAATTPDASVQMRLLRCGLHLERCDAAAALADVDAVMATGTAPAEAYNLGAYAIVLGSFATRFGDANTWSQRAVEDRPGDEASADTRAMVLVMLGRPREAVPALHRGLEVLAGQATHSTVELGVSRMMLARAHLDLGDAASALEHARAARASGVRSPVLDEVERRLGVSAG